MLENPNIIGNPIPRQDFEHYCSDCDGELYFGMTYYEFEGNLFAKIVMEVLERPARFVAGNKKLTGMSSQKNLKCITRERVKETCRRKYWQIHYIWM